MRAAWIREPTRRTGFRGNELSELAVTSNMTRITRGRKKKKKTVISIDRAPQTLPREVGADVARNSGRFILMWRGGLERVYTR